MTSNETADAERAVPEATRAPIPVVGVGASAGGLAATSALLRELGKAPNVAIVIVHHLEPTRESELAALLARAAAMPVAVAEDGARVEINHIYVVPENACLEIENGALVLTVRSDAIGPNLPIDQFLKSLANDPTVTPIAVVLTGTGHDGAFGLKTVKAEGGITFAQDESAEFSGMPESAVATGCVDFVLSPPLIAAELRRIGEGRAALSLPSPDEADAYQKLFEILRSVSGVDFASYKQTTILRRLQRRMFLRRRTDLHEYVALLESDAKEAHALAADVLIHITAFFRDPAAFDLLKTRVFPALLDSPERERPWRFWVCGCSTGEEVYSLAIAAFEYLASTGNASPAITIFGTDVSAGAIDTARAGKYPLSIEHDVSKERLARFFVKVDDGYRIRKDVRDLCVFAKHDVAQDPPFSSLDLVSCRNVLIYLGTALQERVLSRFHYALRDRGFLILGASESAHFHRGFACIDNKIKLHTRISTTDGARLGFPEIGFNEPGLAKLRTPDERHGGLDVTGEADRVLLAAYAPPAVVVSSELAILQFRGQTGMYLDPAPGVASFDLLRMAREDLRVPLRRAIDETRITGHPVKVTSLRGPERSAVQIEVRPFSARGKKFFLVLFVDVAEKTAAVATVPLPTDTEPSVEARHEQELASVSSYLESVILGLERGNEELRAASEEHDSANEELRSTNEELQTAKEELQATNEELRTVNDELSERSVEARGLNDDLTNVLSSVEIPIVLLDPEARIRRFTPAAARLFRLISADVGRPITDLKSFFEPTELPKMLAAVLNDSRPAGRVVEDETGRFFQLTVRPYVTLDHRIDGTVVTAFDIDDVKKSERLLRETRAYAESIIATLRECFLVLDVELRVRSANRAFLQAFRATSEQLQGKRFDEIAEGAWNVPGLRAKLETLRDGEGVEGFRVERDFPVIGWRAFALNARRIEHTTLTLLALEDTTERERAEQSLRMKSESELRRMLSAAAEAVIMSDREGQVVFANSAAATLFGYAAEELAGMPTTELLTEKPDSTVGHRKDKTEFPVESVHTSFDWRDDALTVRFITDVTARHEAARKIREYQDKLQRAAFDAALVEEKERRRIALGIHDGIGQSLAVAQMKLALLKKDMGPKGKVLEEAIGLIEQSIVDARSLTFELTPPMLYDLGLKSALAWLGEDLEKRHGLKVTIRDDKRAASLDDACVAIVFRAVREILMNTLKHAGVREATVSLTTSAERLSITITDRGAGFDLAELDATSKADAFGLFSVREQMAHLGGSVAIETKRGEGARVTLNVPLKPPANAEARSTP